MNYITEADWWPWVYAIEVHAWVNSSAIFVSLVFSFYAIVLASRRKRPVIRFRVKKIRKLAPGEYVWRSTPDPIAPGE